MFFKTLNQLYNFKKPIRYIHTVHSVFSKASVAMSNNTGLELKKVLEALETFAPKHLAESWDNTGLLIEPFTPRAVTKILLTNDLTIDVALEAREMECELIISYHPPIFAPLKAITQTSWKEQVVSMLLERGIALYSPHTSWDSVRGGVNDWLASCFPVASSQPIVPGSAPDLGSGRLLTLEKAVTLSEAVDRVKKLTGLAHVRLAPGRRLAGAGAAEVRTVALCAGSGGSVLKGVSADLYLTGEMLHHDVLDATQRGVSVVLTNHSDSERGFLRTFAPQLAALLGGGARVALSAADRDLLQYMVCVAGEMLHHDVLDATQRGVSVVLTNHSDSERGFLRTFAPQLAALLGGGARVALSAADRDPLHTV